MGAHPFRRAWGATGAILLLASLALAATATPVLGASSSGCEGGGYTVLGLSGEVDEQVQPTTEVFRVQGKYSQFDVVAATFELRDYAFLPTDNALDMTNGVRTPVWASKNPLHGGTLTSPIRVEIDAEDLVMQRSGTTNGRGLTMKIQAKDCAQGGIFQMEVERGDIDPATGLARKTMFVHRLADAPGALQPFFFDNQNFRDNIGRFLTRDEDGNNVDCTPDPANRFCVRVSARTNIGNDVSSDFVARDSPQGGAPPNDTVRVDHPECGSPQQPGIDHCGGISVWLVASGGRMGFVTGEDSVEVANPPTQCIENCQARNQVRGRLAVLGFPFPVDPGDRLEPRLCTPARPDCPR